MGPLFAIAGATRASDADRERTVAALRRHYAAGRLELDELEQRVASAYTARWRVELRALVRDMPFEPPRVDRARVGRGVDRAQRALLHVHFVCWMVLNTILVGLWAWGGGHGVWPALVLVPTTFLLLRHARGSRALSRRLDGGGDDRRRLSLP